MKICIHIPARKGSQRVTRKNLRLMAGKPMYSYALKSALESNIGEVYLNTDDEDLINDCTNRFNEVKIYKRNKSLASNKSSSDEFNFDFISKIKPDILIMVNPVCPLIKPDTIRETLDFFLNGSYDTVITADKTQMQGFCDNKPININLNEQLRPSQENSPIYILNWACTIWKSKTFMKNYKSKGHASLGGKLGIKEIDKFSSLKVSEEEDFVFIEKLIKHI